MDESDEDVGPLAELMTDHCLTSSTHVQQSKTIESFQPLKTTSIINDFYSMFNIRLIFQDLFNILLDFIWSRYFSSSVAENERSLKQIVGVFAIYFIVTAPFPVQFHLISLGIVSIWICFDFVRPMLNYYCWFRCLKTIRRFIETVEKHRAWLKQIHGFQLIRPISSLFDFELIQFRRTLFDETKQIFLVARQVSRCYTNNYPDLISSIELEEFGPLLSSNTDELSQLTNNFDKASIESMLKLCQLQLDESIQLIGIKRPQSFIEFYRYHRCLADSIEHLNERKRNCALTNSINVSVSRQKLSLPYFLLRSAGDKLYEINENDSIDVEQLKRITVDLKTAIYSLEAFQSQPTSKHDEDKREEKSVDVLSATPITSVHRFDDEIGESVDEILVGETGASESIDQQRVDVDDYEQRFLREQTRCLFEELQKAIEGKKQEWNQREQRLLGNQQEIDEKPKLDSPSIVENILPVAHPTSMLDELKRSFVLNRMKINTNEDVFGENDEDNDQIET